VTDRWQRQGKEQRVDSSVRPDGLGPRISRSVPTAGKGLSVLVLVWMVGIMPGRHQASVVAQEVEVVEHVETHAVYRAVLPIKFSSGDKELTHITLPQETRAGSIDCQRNENIQPEWRSVVENYRTVNARVRRIQAGRELGVPHTLLTWEALTRMMRDAGYDLSKFSGRQSPGAEKFSRLQGGRLVALSAGLLSLGAPYAAPLHSRKYRPLHAPATNPFNSRVTP
jgi:hypothetical protein